MKKQTRKSVERQKRATKKAQKRRLKLSRVQSGYSPYNDPKITAPIKEALEQVAHISLTALEQGVHHYFSQEGHEGNLKDLWEVGVDVFSFSCGIRGYLSEEGLKVTAPLTWDTGKENPVVKDYLADLWNFDLPPTTTQINSISFLVADTNGDEEEVLACCVISVGVASENVSGFLVFRECTYDEGTNTLKIDGGHAFTHSQAVLNFPLLPMASLKKELGAEQPQTQEAQEETPTDTQENSAPVTQEAQVSEV